jgi:sporulation protein YlmC with PRC-barrel domain
MTTKLSRMYGMDILTDSGKFIGKAEDFVLDMEGGEVSRILLEQLPPGKDDARKALLQKSILHKNVKSVDDVIVVSRASPPVGAER